jgi:recombination protein RecR
MTNLLPRPVERLIEAFRRLPGIGPKTASRLTFYLIGAAEEESTELAAALADLGRGTRFCSICGNITAVDVDPCMICADPSRDAGLICILEDALDVVAIERTGQFRGHYHVLQGAISPVDGVGPEDLRIEELTVRLDQGGVEEIILATNPTMEGEATAMYLRRQVDGYDLRVTRLARGLPSGGDVEYADANTLGQALQGRQEV